MDCTPFATKCQGIVTEAKIVDGHLELVFDDAREDLADKFLCFPSSFLRMYGPSAGRPVELADGPRAAEQTAFGWLQCYADADSTPALEPSWKSVWKNDEGFDLQRRDYNAVCSSDAANLELLQTLARHGVVVLDNIPAVEDPSFVRQFADECLGGMQKNPVRDEPAWIIRRKEDAASSAYDYTSRLNNHTDQAPAPHGVPGLVAIMHYACGHGVNTFVDSHAVAAALRVRDPEAFRLLSTYGNCHQRDFIQSRVDFRDSHRRVSPEKMRHSLLVNSKRPILQCDSQGAVIRVQFNEIARMPSTVPFGQFPSWYRAYLLWNEMIHSPEFEVEVAMNAGQLLLIDNWRVLHGRKGGASSPDRVLMGGTVLREGFVSKALQLMGVGHHPLAEVLA